MCFRIFHCKVLGGSGNGLNLNCFLVRYLLPIFCFCLLWNNTSRAASFVDDFNRPNSPSVGNGWLDATGTGTTNLSIFSDRAQAPDPSPGNVIAGIFRPFSLGAGVSISATLTQENGFGGLSNRFSQIIALNSNGDINSGYGIIFHRGDINFQDSVVILVDNGVQLETQNIANQFGPSIDVAFTIFSDGSVAGLANSSSFSFGPRAFNANGTNFLYTTELSDPRATSTFIDPSVDNITINNVPEPASALVGVALFFMLSRRHRRC